MVKKSIYNIIYFLYKSMHYPNKRLVWTIWTSRKK